LGNLIASCCSVGGARASQDSSDAIRDALAKTANRDQHLLPTIRYDRALAYEIAGQHAKAKGDLERLCAADPSFRDVRQRLGALRASR
jgi:Tfp pilus assembly protein PilF